MLLWIVLLIIGKFSKWYLNQHPQYPVKSLKGCGKFLGKLQGCYEIIRISLGCDEIIRISLGCGNYVFLFYQIYSSSSCRFCTLLKMLFLAQNITVLMIGRKRLLLILWGVFCSCKAKLSHFSFLRFHNFNEF